MGSRIAGVAGLAALIGAVALWRWGQAPEAATRSAPGGTGRVAAGLVPLGREGDPRLQAAFAPALTSAPGAPPGSLAAVGRGAGASFSPEGVTVSFAGPEGERGSALRWSVEGARGVAPEGEDPLPGVQNFFIGSDPAKWRTNVPRYAGAVYRGLRPGLEVKATPVEGGARLQVTATAEALRDTWFRWEGQRTASAEGDRLALETPHGTVTQSLEGPVRIAETRPVPGGIAYRVEPTGAIPIGGGGQFSLGIAWSGYIPGLSTGGGLNEVHVAPDGTVTLVGDTASASFGTVGDTTLNGQDAYVMKLWPDAGLAWGTYLGGTGDEFGEDVAFDSSGNLFIVGRTLSTNFPVTDALFPNPAGNGDAFVVSLTPGGNVVRWSTYLGGGNREFGLAIGAAPSSGEVWVSGMTGSTNFPLASAFISTNPNTTCFTSCTGFLSGFSNDGSTLLLSSYLGPATTSGGTVEIYDLAFDQAENVYVAGNTTAGGISFPGLPPPLQSYGGARDGFLFRLDTSTNQPGYFSYFGGSGVDVIGTLDIDATGAIYLAGKTTSSNFPRDGGLSAVPVGLDDAFIAKLGPGASFLDWSLLFGGGDYDEVRNLDIGPDGAPYLVGLTQSPTITGFAGGLAGPKDAFIARANPSGSLDWGAYLGGSSEDDGRGIAVDGRSNIYVGGSTLSNDFPAGALFPRAAGANGFLAKLDTTPPDGGVVGDGPQGDLDRQTDAGSLSANWSGFSDPDARIANYQWALGTTPGGAEVMGFADAGPVTQATRSGLSLVDGQWYYATVRAITTAGLSAQVGSDGVLVDASPPPAGTIRDGTSLTAELDYQRSTDLVAANWDPMADPHTPPTTYEWAIGRTSGSTDLQGYVEIGVAFAAARNLTLAHGERYYVTVRATNDAGLSTTVTSDGVLVDDTGPAAGTVDDGPSVDLDSQPRTDPLRANWSNFTDPESDIERYEWAIGTSSGDSSVLGFANVGLQTSASAGTSVTPTAGGTYFVTVRAYNRAGDFTQVSSDGVRILGVLGDPCAAAGQCASGECQSNVCCTRACGICEACNLSGSVGACTPVANNTPCPNSLACDGTETCQAGACVPGTPVTCTQPADGEYLTCQDPPGGCVATPRAPVITSIPPGAIATGRQYRYQPQVLGSRPLSFSLCGAPAGATIDPVSGLVTWLPSQPATASFCVQATNSVGSDSQSFQVVATDQPLAFGEVALRLSTDGGTPHFGARQLITAGVTNSIAADVRDLKLVMAASGLALAGADGGASAETCDQGRTLPVSLVPASGAAAVPVVAYVCRNYGEQAQLVAHLERADGLRLTDDETLNLEVGLDKVQVGCACSSAPGALAVVALLWAVRRRRRGRGP